MAIEIARHDEPDGIRLVISGEVDMTTGERFEDEVLRAEENGAGRLTLDLSDVDFFDSTGLQILLDADVRAREAGRKVVVVAGDGEVARVLALAQVQERLNVAVIE